VVVYVEQRAFKKRLMRARAAAHGPRRFMARAAPVVCKVASTTIFLWIDRVRRVRARLPHPNAKLEREVAEARYMYKVCRYSLNEATRGVGAAA
jgi:hypothetical protein